MGIYERDYIRHREPQHPAFGRGLFAAMRMWSVTTWLIVACVAVFVVDELVPQRPGVWKPVVVSTRVPHYVEQVGGAQFQALPEPAQFSMLVGQEKIPAPGDWAGERRVLRTQAPQFVRQVFDLSATPPDHVGTLLYQWMPPLKRWLYFSTDTACRKVEFWRLIGFQFLHANALHLCFNMLGLFFFGPLVERHLGAKRYLAFYLLCGICGALMYLGLNLGGYVVSLYTQRPVAVPWLLFNSTAEPLIGASAGVFGVLMAGAYLAPNAVVLLFFVLPMRLVTMAYGMVILALITVAFGGSNAGGEAGHLGGAAAGFYFIRNPHHLHGFFDFLGWVDPTSHHYRRRRGERRVSEVDRILAKVDSGGVHSLTAREKRILRESAERK